MSIRTKNILTAVLAVLVVGGFIFVAEGLKTDKKDDRLAAIENATTTTVKRTTTTREPTTTTSTTALTVNTTAVTSLTTTTARSTTATTKKPTTATTKKPSTATTSPAPTAAPVPHDGPGTETSDNTASFTRNADGSFATSSAAPCPDTERTDPFCFHVGSEGGISLVVEIRNNTGRTVRFPNGLKILVNLQNPNGTTSQFLMDASSVTSLVAHEGVRVKSSAQISDTGQYSFTASCEIDYGP